MGALLATLHHLNFDWADDLDTHHILLRVRLKRIIEFHVRYLFLITFYFVGLLEFFMEKKFLLHIKLPLFFFILRSIAEYLLHRLVPRSLDALLLKGFEEVGLRAHYLLLVFFFLNIQIG